MPKMFTPNRRAMLMAAVGVGLGGVGGLAWAANPEQAFAGSPWRKLTDADWKRKLPPESYQVLRQQGTEAPFTSPLLNEHRRGVFACLGCGLPLFKSQWKFDSGTGWPSFFQVIDGAVGKKSDFALMEPRTEYHCARCLGHQGHVFDDGPQPTGLRYCNDGVALSFVAA